MADEPRLIERGFPLKQASLDSVHEKNVRHGHISTLHIWPARRPLAACRAALIATLLPDPGDPEERRRLIERIGGRVVPKIEKKNVAGNRVEVEREETIGGILHWGREAGPDLQFFRDEIRKAYDGRAPRVLDPFAGGGAIPLEAMRLGCEVTAIDINPVAWFILKCTLEYPQKLAGQKRLLPDFVLRDREFIEAFLKAQGLKGATLRTQLERLGLGDDAATEHPANAKSRQNGSFGFDGGVSLDADLAWHVRAWGRWVLARARADLERFYPTIDGKPTVAYLWARTVKCKNCRATIPLLKTKWLCKKDNKRVLLKVEPNADRSGPVFSILSGNEAATQGGNGAQRREYDKKIGAGTMSRAGATCVCCGLPSMTMEDIQAENRAGRGDALLTSVILETPQGKAYSPPPAEWISCWQSVAETLERCSAELPHGLPREPIDSARPSPNARGLSGLTRHGLYRFDLLFNRRQLLSLLIFVIATREVRSALEGSYPELWTQAITSYLAVAIDRLSDRNTTICHWDMGRETVSNTFQRYALRINWDYAEVNPFAETTVATPEPSSGLR